MGLTINAHPNAPVQLDALMGAVNAIQEMLLRIDGTKLMLLPACPDRFNTGEFANWYIPQGRVDLRWNKDNNQILLTVHAETDSKITVCPPSWCGVFPFKMQLKKGSVETFKA